MEKQIIVIRDILLAMVCLSFVACAGRRVGESVPPKPDYSDSAQWYITTRSADVDIFYVTSTCDYPSSARWWVWTLCLAAH